MLNPRFILHPRSLTVLRGESYSLECYYTLDIHPVKVSFYDNQQPEKSFFVYEYPNGTQPFPVYKVEQAVLGEHEYHCTGLPLSDVYNGSLFKASYQSSIDVLEGEHWESMYNLIMSGV